jgi:hypothetical protein
MKWMTGAGVDIKGWRAAPHTLSTCLRSLKSRFSQRYTWGGGGGKKKCERSSERKKSEHQ